MRRRTLLVVRVICAVVMLHAFAYAWWLWEEGPTGSTMPTAVRSLEIALAAGMFCLACLLLSFGTRKS